MYKLLRLISLIWVLFTPSLLFASDHGAPAEHGAEAPAEGKEGEGEHKGPAKPSPQYYSLTPDIVTNFQSKGKKPAYIMVSVDLLIDSEKAKEALVTHNPLIRNALISLFYQQTEENIKSFEGREKLRLEAKKILMQLLLDASGNAQIRDVLFSKYIWQ